MFVGHDGGFDVSNDGGLTWDYHNNIAVGQFYQVSADMRRPYWVCGGLQDNNAWCGPSALRASNGPVNTDWFTVAGGDGFYTRQDPTDWAIVYAESQDGYATRHDMRNGTQKSIRPNSRPRSGAVTPERRVRRAGNIRRTPSADTPIPLPSWRRTGGGWRPRQRPSAAVAAARPTCSMRLPTSSPSASTGTRPSKSRPTIRR